MIIKLCKNAYNRNKNVPAPDISILQKTFPNDMHKNVINKICNMKLQYYLFICLFIYLGFYDAFNTVQVTSQCVVGRAEETSTDSLLGFCTVNCRPTESNYQLSHLRPCWGSNPGLRAGRREYYHSATVAPHYNIIQVCIKSIKGRGNLGI